MSGKNIFLEISPFKADNGELVGQSTDRGAFGNPVPEIQRAKSSEGPSGAVPRLLLR